MSEASNLNEPIHHRVGSSAWPTFGRRLVGILFRPAATWNEISKNEPSLGAMLWPHVVILVLARALAETVGVLAAGYPVLHALKQFVFSSAALFVLMWVFAMVAGTLSVARRGDGGFLGAFRLSGYTLTPLLVCGVLAVLPFRYMQVAVDILAMPWAFYVLGTGIGPMLKADDKNPAALAALLCGALLILWVLMPGLVRELLVFLANQPAT